MLLLIALPCAAAALAAPPTLAAVLPHGACVRSADRNGIRMLLGADGLPMKKDGGGGGGEQPAAAGGGGLIGADGGPMGDLGRGVAMDSYADDEPFQMPDDLADFDPSFDPLAVKRPEFDLAAASGRPEEVVWGAIAAESADVLGEWVDHMQNAGIGRLLGLFSRRRPPRAAPAAPRRPTSTGPSRPASTRRRSACSTRARRARDAVLNLLRDAQSSRERLLVHCADGHRLTGVVLADWLLTDYIGGDNYEEACHLLQNRKRLAGVERVADPAIVERWVVEGHI